MNHDQAVDHDDSDRGAANRNWHPRVRVHQLTHSAIATATYHDTGMTSWPERAERKLEM
jgi:hypothetical protein